MARKKIENIIKDKISPYSLSDTGKSKVAQLIRNYPYELLVECIDIAVTKYFCYDRNGVLKQESA